MRLSAWHKAQGDEVEIAFPLAADSYDRIYRSKQFEYTPDDTVPWPCEVVSGGTGYDLTTLLTPEQDTIYPDYPTFSCDYALGRLTRGCIRRCPWCVVWRQDGKVRQVAELDDFWRGQNRVRLLDDNLTALPDLFIKTCAEISAHGAQAMFDSLDIRLMTEDMARALASVKRWERSGCTRGAVHFAWDTPADESAVRRGIEALRAGGFPLWAANFYVLIGFDTTPEEDHHRVTVIRELGAHPFVMPFDKTDRYQRRFARWVNHKAVFATVPWEEYSG